MAFYTMWTLAIGCFMKGFWDMFSTTAKQGKDNIPPEFRK